MVRIRTGFISNSSTTSFTCDICGESFSGMNGDYGDTYEYYCTNYHYMCSNCVDLEEQLDFSTLVEYWNSHEEHEWLDEEYQADIEVAIRMQDKEQLYELLIRDGFFDLEPGMCPCCTLKEVANKDIKNYLLARCRMNEHMIMDEMRKRLKNFSGLQKYVEKRIP